jgi:hypothetical protein
MLNLKDNSKFIKKNYIILLISIFSFTLFSQVNVEAQDADSQCTNMCKREALTGITNCKDISKQCVRENSDDPLTVLDYCTDSFLAYCESVISGDYETCLSVDCGINIVESRFQDEFDPDNLDAPPTSSSCTTNGAAVINPVLTDIQNLTNDAWEVAACAAGLCPLSPVFDGTINIGCGGDLEAALDALCTLETVTTFPECKGFWADVNVTSLDGLQFMQYENFMVTEISGAAGTQTCPYSSGANDSEDFACSYSGTGVGSTILLSNETITLVTESLVIKVQCEGLFGTTDLTQYSGSFTCTTSNPTAKATYGLCAGSCDVDSVDVGVMTYLQVPKSSNLSLDLGSTFKCEFSPAGDPTNTFLDEFVPLFRDQIAEALKEPVQETVNSIIPSLPFPASTCNAN